MKPEKTIRKIKSGEPVTICAFGDSLSYGWMVRKGYIDFLEEMVTEEYPNSKVTFLNCGVPGNTARDGLRRLRHDVLDANPDCVFIQFALNDAYVGYGPDSYKNAINNIVEDISANTDAEMLLVTSVTVNSKRENDFVEEFYDAMKSVGKKHGVPIAEVHEYWKEKIREGVNFHSLVQADGVHPTVAGYRLMAEAIMKSFRL